MPTLQQCREANARRIAASMKPTSAQLSAVVIKADGTRIPVGTGNSLWARLRKLFGVTTTKGTE
jgi:hypothetical protein